MKLALQDASAQPQAVKMLAELTELTDSQSSALELLQAAVDQPNSDSQTWNVAICECVERSITCNTCETTNCSICTSNSRRKPLQKFYKWKPGEGVVSGRARDFGSSRGILASQQGIRQR